MNKQHRRAGEVQIDDAELTKIAKATGAPKGAFTAVFMLSWMPRRQVPLKAPNHV
jgi:hypothetical protein